MRAAICRPRTRRFALEHDAVVADVPSLPTLPSGNGYTIRTVVDKVALFFAVSSHGHGERSGASADQVRDNGKAPRKILLFTPQSKLPLRVGLLVDTSGSVNERFGFEKHAASKSLEQLLTTRMIWRLSQAFPIRPASSRIHASHESLGNGTEA